MEIYHMPRYKLSQLSLVSFAYNSTNMIVATTRIFTNHYLCNFTACNGTESLFFSLIPDEFSASLVFRALKFSTGGTNLHMDNL